ncbi:response regulator [Phenylobacterium sp. J367]|uniref:response regulator n=1 Tax=Phenylobacterium sp. J367 TaxID=2898435 RepID=UPI00215128F8|nr:response regulator [Phenylobacterium sp. J367]MCR5877676.1 response regulator [Phenylobacterium sp. J367]
MFANNDAKTIQRMAPLLSRVLVVDPQPTGAQVLGDQMRTLAKTEIWTAPTTVKGLKQADKINPQLIFCELSGDKVDGIDFTRRLRRSDFACRKAPVILVTTHATAGAILAARDAGVHEFLRKPFIVKDLIKRLEAVTLFRRDWVEAVHYVGPDRRRFNSGDYAGPLKRHSDTEATPEAVRIAQALKIVRSALTAVGEDRRQALRALIAQTDELLEAGRALADQKLIAAATAFHHFLFEAQSRPDLGVVDFERRAVPPPGLHAPGLRRAAGRAAVE